MEVLIAIDAIAPPQVKYEGITIIAGSDRLTIQPSVLNFSELKRACDLARNAIDDLPQTPFVAVGFNISYSADNCIADVDELIIAAIDQHASDASYSIVERQLNRTVKRNDGKLNIFLSMAEDQSRTVALNFDIQSSNPETLRNWLDIDPAVLLTEIRKVFETVLKINPDIIDYETTNQN